MKKASEQIVEIARTICGNYDEENNKCLCDLVNGICDLDCWAGRHPSEAIYQAGYRDQREVIKEFVKRVEKYLANCTFTMGQTSDIKYALKKATEEMVGGLDEQTD